MLSKVRSKGNKLEHSRCVYLLLVILSVRKPISKVAKETGKLRSENGSQNGLKESPFASTYVEICSIAANEGQCDFDHRLNVLQVESD